MPLRRLGQRLQRSRAIRTANVGLVVVSALTTASFALVVEDVLPKPNPDAELVWPRVLVLALALIGVIGAVVWRSKAQRSTGALFYVQMLDEGMADQRIDALDTAANSRLSRRSITRWLDLDGSTVNGVIDVSGRCQEAGTTLEELLNGDRDDTANSVAPNALWPMALALGMYLPAGGPLRVTELPAAKPDGGDQEFQLKRDTDPAQLSVTSEELDGAAGDRVGVWLALTQARKCFSADRFRQFDVRTAYTVTPDAGDPANAADRHYQAEELGRLAAGLAETLVALKNEHRDREFVVVAMISKTMALAVGWHLAQAECAFFRNTHLMHFDRNHGYIPMRVRSSQPTAMPVRGDLPRS